MPTPASKPHQNCQDRYGQPLPIPPDRTCAIELPLATSNADRLLKPRLYRERSTGGVSRPDPRVSSRSRCLVPIPVSRPSSGVPSQFRCPVPMLLELPGILFPLSEIRGPRFLQLFGIPQLRA